MNSKTCFKILEVAPDATDAELRQAYRDLVNVWHPDRFSHNPRLRRKAEEKLKEINAAYRHLRGTPRESWTEDVGEASGEGKAEGKGKKAEGGQKKARSSSPEEPAAPDRWKRRRRFFLGRPLRWMIAAGAGLLAGAMVLFLLWPSDPASKTPTDGGPSAAISSPPVLDSEADSGEWPQWLVRLQKRLEWWERHGPPGDGPDPAGDSVDPAASGAGHPTDGSGASPSPASAEDDDWPTLIPPELEKNPLTRYPEYPDQVPVPDSPPTPDPPHPRASRQAPPAAAQREALSLSPEVARRRASLVRQLHARADRYLDRGDGTVVDRRTDRTWARTNSFLATGRLLSYAEAIRYVQSLETGGHRDWRLPRSDELAEIYLNGPRFPDAGAPVLWSSEVYVKGWHNVVRVVRPESDRVAFAYQSERGAVHAVRP